MTDQKELIFGRMTEPYKYSSTARRMSKVTLPPRNIKEHSRFLLDSLGAVEARAKMRCAKKVRGAKNTLITVEYAPGTELKIDSLESKRDGVRVVYNIPEINKVLLDVPNQELRELKKKITEYGEKKRISKFSKDKNPKPANNSLVAPIERFDELKFKQTWGLSLKAEERDLKRDKEEWFELSCRGGVYEPEESDRSRKEVLAALELLKVSQQTLPELAAPERILFFLKCTPDQLRQIFELTDCLFEVDLIPKATLNFLMTDQFKISYSDLPRAHAPSENAPSLVIMDSGISAIHPLLEDAVAFMGSVHPEDQSPGDEIGHGTEMTGVALFGEEVSEIAAERRPVNAEHWIESIRLFTKVDSDVHAKPDWPLWAKMTSDAIRAVESKGRQVKQKAYCLAVTAEQKFPGSATSWSLAADQLAYNNGHGRIICVSIGNTRDIQASFNKNFPDENFLQKLEDPSQAANVLSIGAFTKHETLPRSAKFSALKPLARAGDPSPHTRSGRVESDDFKIPIKPDVVFEGGNFAVDDLWMRDDTIPTLTAATTGHKPDKPLVGFWGTSLSTALASKFVVDVWKRCPELRPETVRGLVVHSATWTKEMIQRFGSNTNDLLALCGYGVPSLELATFCEVDRATILVEDELANFVQNVGDSGLERQMKLFELPLPKNDLLSAQSNDVELRVTLSYFGEPNSARGQASRGMDLAWDIQGPAETDAEFVRRINRAMRAEGETAPGTKSFSWIVGPQKRKRGTVQSDRWKGNAADLAGRRLIAVYPRHGWWNRRKELKLNKTKFSLIMTAITPGIEIYNYVRQNVQVTTQNSVLITQRQK